MQNDGAKPDGLRTVSLSTGTCVSNYIQIMDMLIDTEEDLNLIFFVEKGIISHKMGNNAD